MGTKGFPRTRLKYPGEVLLEKGPALRRLRFSVPSYAALFMCWEVQTRQTRLSARRSDASALQCDFNHCRSFVSI